jgi:gamma-glutamylcyclotransferase (GGCT)/AIG2-like uncharacterized protein YtfP
MLENYHDHVNSDHAHAVLTEGHPVPNLFSYGSLQLPEVWETVVGLNAVTQLALLPDFRSGRIKDQTFPGIRPQRGASCRGTLFLDLPEMAWERLDRFEDDFYRRETVTVVTESGIQSAEAYVVKAECVHLLLDEEWNLDLFRHRDLRRFLRQGL